jgi:RNA recognition motif-containing protein
MPSQRKTVFFEEVSLECTATEIFEAFKRFGVILEIQLRTNGKTIANSGSAYGFVRFTDLNSAHHAKKEMEGITFFGRKLKYALNHFVLVVILPYILNSG